MECQHDIEREREREREGNGDCGIRANSDSEALPGRPRICLLLTTVGEMKELEYGEMFWDICSNFLLGGDIDQKYLSFESSH